MDNLQIIEERFGTDYRRSNDEFMFNCPFCLNKRGKEDHDRKLYVNIKSLKFHCFKCESKGRLGNFKTLDSSYGVYSSLEKLNCRISVEEDEDYNMFYFPVSHICKNTVAYNYCLRRGITEELIDYYDIRLGIKDLIGRIVIPNNVYGNCWTDMYSARSIIGQIPKYKNPSGSAKSKLVFNLKNIKDNQDKVIIVEGVITAICGGKDCVATYGCHPSKDQLDSIIDKNPKSIYCCLDGDSAGQSGMKFLLQYLKDNYSGIINYVKMPEDQDACDMGFERFREYIEENKLEYDGDLFLRLSQLFG